MAGAQVFENTTDISSYSYDATKQELVSYDTPDIVKLKVQYLLSKGMAGSMFWEVRIFILPSYLSHNKLNFCRNSCLQIKLALIRWSEFQRVAWVLLIKL